MEIEKKTNIHGMKRKRVAKPWTTKKRARRTLVPIARPLALSVSALDVKYNDRFANNLSVNATGVIVPLYQGMIQGVSEIAQFVGSKIKPISIYAKINWANGDPAQAVRYIIFQWMDASVPTVLGVLEATNALSPIRFDNRENVANLRDVTNSLPIYSVGGAHNIYTKEYIKGRRMLPSQYNVTTGNWQKGGLFCLFISDSAIAPSPTVSYWFRTSYTDF